MPDWYIRNSRRVLGSNRDGTPEIAIERMARESARRRSELAALLRLYEIARRHYGKHADLADALDRLEALR